MLQSWCKKAFFSTEYILVNNCGTLLKKGAVEVSVWIEEDVKKAYFSTEYSLVSSTFVDRNIFCGKESFLYLLFYPKWKLYSTFFKSVPHLLTKIYYVDKKAFYTSSSIQTESSIAPFFKSVPHLLTKIYSFEKKAFYTSSSIQTERSIVPFSKVFHTCWPKYILLKRKLFYISSIAPFFKSVPQLLTKIFSVE